MHCFKNHRLNVWRRVDFTGTLKHSLSFHTHPHTYMHTHTAWLTVTHMYAHTLFLTDSHCRTHTDLYAHTLIQKQIHVQTLPYSLLMHIHTHTRTHMHIHTQCTHTLGIHRRTVLSLEADATRWPDGENRTDKTASCHEMKNPKSEFTLGPVHSTSFFPSSLDLTKAAHVIKLQWIKYASGRLNHYLHQYTIITWL